MIASLMLQQALPATTHSAEPGGPSRRRPIQVESRLLNKWILKFDEYYLSESSFVLRVEVRRKLSESS